MRLAIRFADKIIGGLIILALGMLVFVIIMLGSSQRWFARDFQYKAYFNSAAGISTNMPVLYKGFTIGRIKTVELLENDAVEVVFTIFDEYNERVTEGSLVEIQRSPIGLGNQFLFSPGKGTEPIPGGGTIPTASSEEGKRLLDMGLSRKVEVDDSINNIVNNVNAVVEELQEAIKGNDRTNLGRIFGGVETTVTGISGIPAEIEETVHQFNTQLKPILTDLKELTNSIRKPDGTVMSILDSEGQVYKDLVKTLDGLAGTMQGLEKTIEFIPSQIPQLAIIISDVNAMLNTVQDLLISLTNNPLLKDGIPDRKETQVGGTQSRDAGF
jgi:phospholipid/cholesterol/gamma-HCH transport system substrate-binding protein